VTLPDTVWQTHSAGRGSKGHRWYAWALVHIDEADLPGQHRLLIRRNQRTGEQAFYRAYSPTPVPLAAFVRVAGTRWRIEENIQAGKGLAALDEHQVRRWAAWHRWTVLAMLAHAFLAVTAAAEHTHHAVTHELIPLTCNEIRHLFAMLGCPARHGITHLAALVTMATTSPSAGPRQPLPPTKSCAAMITIYGCRTSPGLSPAGGLGGVLIN
jgi:hypothetical protein